MRVSFSLRVALPPVFGLLAGLSIELQIKAIAALLDLENREHHRIADLSKHVGITLSSEHAAVADALSEYVYWASKYPTPRNEARFDKAYDIFRKAGFPAALGERNMLARYESLWTVYESAYGRASMVIDEPYPEYGANRESTKGSGAATLLSRGTGTSPRCVN
jgi:hypothetical protein